MGEDPPTHVPSHPTQRLMSDWSDAAQRSSCRLSLPAESWSLKVGCRSNPAVCQDHGVPAFAPSVHPTLYTGLERVSAASSVPEGQREACEPGAISSWDIMNSSCIYSLEDYQEPSHYNGIPFIAVARRLSDVVPRWGL
ncbi:uncharacterized protein N7477_003791 [Penicillium maclennaniae]|uniref:uncharacterized protein n=1 Tax=Penicillium maclennaniae TaxID=1343394 RepID=UPI002542555F|nr:uncharacterized protein N7477_003791 [Penicillium maclennaniae]KAJ5678158.1 hypothetical protein N7477_003791 [Penicillium maclennaniae]